MIDSMDDVSKCNPTSEHIHFVSDETQRFEFFVLDTADLVPFIQRGTEPDRVEPSIRELYEKGWQIVSVMNTKIFFHRPLKMIKHYPAIPVEVVDF